MKKIISVLVVDDSAFMRKMIREMLTQDAQICIIGQAKDGADAVHQVEALKPDVITLDVEMPVMNGLDALTEIMARCPTPVVMLSSRTQKGADMTLRCLAAGAIDFIAKPSGTISLDIERVSDELIQKVKTAAGVRANRPLSGVCLTPPFLGAGSQSPTLLVIGASTGGPRALGELLPALPTGLPVPVIIIQHMPTGFTHSLAARLNEAASFPVREAKEGERLEPGVALLAPGGRHLRVEAPGIVRLSNEPPIHGVRPSIDVTLASATRLYPTGITAVLLTGMGRDGANGLKQVYCMGGETLAEDETTCAVYGMPKAAVEIGAVRHLLPLTQMAEAITRVITGEH